MALCLLLAGAASLVGSGPLLTGSGPARDALHRTTPSPSPSPTTTASPDPGSVLPSPSESDGGVMRYVVLALVAVFAGLVLFALTRLLRWLLARIWERRPEMAPRDPRAEVEVLPATRFAATMRERRSDYRAALSDGSPRNAVVACWHLLESDAAAAGLPRRDCETSSEYVRRMLALLGPGGERTAYGLEQLYREARFSGHDVGEDARLQAQHSLEELMTSLTRGTGVHRD